MEQQGFSETWLRVPRSLTPMPVITSLVVLTFLYLAYRWALPRPIPGIPYDETSAKSILGSLPQIIAYARKNKALFPWFAEQNDKYNSPLFQFWNGPLTKPMVILADYQEVQDILVRRTKEFDRSQLLINIFQPGAPDHHITMRSADPRFKGNKELVRDLMSPSFLNSTSAPEIYKKTQTLIELWSLKAKLAGDRPFDASLDMFNAAIDMITAAAFAFNDSLSGTRHELDYLNSLENLQFSVGPDGSVQFPRPPLPRDIASILDVIAAAGGAASSPLPRVSFYFAKFTSPKLRRSIAHKDQIMRREIEKSLARINDEQKDDGASRSAVDNILRREKAVAAKEGRPADFFSGRIRDELFGYVLAGHETSQTALCWNLKLLADHQECQAKLRKALREGFPAAAAECRQPTAAEITKANIPYLDAVIEEGLRVRQPVRLGHREAMVDTVILGRNIPKGTTIIFCSSGPGFKRPAIPVDDVLRSESSRTKFHGGAWNPDDLHLYIPERWLTMEGQGDSSNPVFNPNAGPFLAFSMGPRGCFGKKLAYLEIRMMTVLLVWNFRFRKLEGEIANYDEKEGITSFPKNCYVLLEEYKN
ncbi:cytochrome P450 [Xylariales sp. PMI_506]|nr:cytochrome P450 [Xylariales sp. PMI_506]